MLNKLADQCYKIADDHGFHEKGNDMAVYVANLHGEASELWESYRSDTLLKPCDKAAKMIEPLSNLEEEIADIIIRALDTAKAYNVDVDKAVTVKSVYNETRPYRHGGKIA